MSRALVHVLELPELQEEVCKLLPRVALFHLSQVSTSWGAAASASLWSFLPGLWPVLHLMPDSSLQCEVDTSLNVSGHPEIGLSLRIDLTGEQWEIVLRRLRYVKRIHFGHDVGDRAVDMSIIAAIQTSLTVKLLFPRLQTITMSTSSPSWLGVGPPHSIAVAGVVITRGRRNSAEVQYLTAAFPQASTFGIACLGYCLRSHITDHTSVLHIHGQTLDVVVAVIGLRPAWCIEELHIHITITTPPQFDGLLSVVTSRCVSTLRLSVIVHEFAEDQRWSLTPAVLRALSTFWLSSLHLQAPMHALIADADLVMSVRSIPTPIQTLATLGRSLPPSGFPLLWLEWNNVILWWLVARKGQQEG
ncbi:hypothetical protein BD626DRAFT_539216 [Schizophyllum amplum]|uniref:F-box domain-containing protein n=1 Tax=Schizophyllum amplum TaxID=97359 RepID=A0A550C4M1_9AGAR|nr:hypothetical protein BD626DRAFT_539216 [Auriculariopsis ampla]